MRCEQCQRIHHELPDILVPYKRYDRDSIEKMITEPSPSVAADESTLRRIRNWFSVWIVYALHALSAMEKRLAITEGELSNPLQSSLPQHGHTADGWMARTCSKLGMRLLYAKRYAAESKGKVECFNRVVDSFLAEVSLSKPSTLEKLNEQFHVWLSEFTRSNHILL